MRIVPVKCNVPGWEGKVLLPHKKHMFQDVLRTTLDAYTTSLNMNDNVRFYHQCSSNAAEKRRRLLVEKRDTIYAMFGANTFLTNIQLDSNVCVMYMVPAFLYSPGKTIDAWRRAQATAPTHQVPTIAFQHNTQATTPPHEAAAPQHTPHEDDVLITCGAQVMLHQSNTTPEAKLVEGSASTEAKLVEGSTSPEAKTVHAKPSTKSNVVHAKPSTKSKVVHAKASTKSNVVQAKASTKSKIFEGKTSTKSKLVEGSTSHKAKTVRAQALSEAKAVQAKTVQAKALSEAKAVQAKTVQVKATQVKAAQANALSEAKALPEAKAVQAKASQEQGAKQDYQGSSYEEQDEVNVLEDSVLEKDFEDFADLEQDYDSGFLPTKTSNNTKNALGEAKAKASRKGEAFTSRKNKQDDAKKHTSPRSGRDEHVSTSNKTVRNNTECSNKVCKTKNHALEAQTLQDDEHKEEPKIESLGNQLGVAGQVAPRKRKMQDMANAVARAQEELAAYHAQYLAQQRKCFRLATMMDALVEKY